MILRRSNRAEAPVRKQSGRPRSMGTARKAAMDLVHYVQIALLALIQGAAELLPVSSSAHGILAQRVMGMDPSRPEQVFLLVMLHTGTRFAVLVYFWPRWQRLWTPSGGTGISGPSTSPRQFVRMLIVATAVPGTLVVALKFLIERIILVRVLKHPEGEVEELFKHLPLVAAGLAAVGLLIIAAGGRETRDQASSEGGSSAGYEGGGGLTGRSAVWIGLVQAFCLPFRGFSRSGATISTGLLCGVSRALSEDFSFALAVVLPPPVQAYSIYKLLKANAL